MARRDQGELSAKTLATIDKMFVKPTRAFEQSLRRRPPATAFLTLERAYDRVKVGPNEVTDTFAEIMEAMRRDPSAIKAPSLPTPTTARRRELCALFDQLDALYPGATAIMVVGSGGVGRDRLVTDLRTAKLDERAAKLRGELRSDALQELARHGLEQTYGWFNRMLLQAHWAIRGERFHYSLSFGSEVIKTTQLNLVPSGTLPVAAKLRNAAAHGHWRYDPKTRRIALRDKSGWADNPTMPDLHSQMRRAIESAADLSWILARSTARHMFGGLAPVFRLMAVGASQGEIDRAASSTVKQCVDAYAHLHSLGWQDTPPY